MIIDLLGQIVVGPYALEDGVVVGLVTPEKLETTSGSRSPKARRPEPYGKLVERQAPVTPLGWEMERRQ